MGPRRFCVIGKIALCAAFAEAHDTGSNERKPASLQKPTLITVPMLAPWVGGSSVPEKASKSAVMAGGAARGAVYDEQGVKATRSKLESKGLELYRAPAGLYTFNVGVHSMFVYSVTQCVPLQKDIELRFALKHAMSQHRPDGQDGLALTTGIARTDGTFSLFYAF